MTRQGGKGRRGRTGRMGKRSLSFTQVFPFQPFLPVQR
jgi:hypothetical protein